MGGSDSPGLRRPPCLVQRGVESGSTRPNRVGAASGSALVSTTTRHTKKEGREAENASAPGGLRNPARYVQSSPHARRTGILLADTLEKIIKQNPLITTWLLDEGAAGYAKFTEQLEDQAVAAVVAVLGAKSGRRGSRSSWRADIVEAYVRHASDPDTQLPGWLESGVPTGVAQEIPSCGVFPKVVTEAEKASELWRCYASCDAGSNYKSATENSKAFADEVDRLIRLGYVKAYKNLAEVEAAIGKVVVSKVAAILKQKEDGSVKVRVIIDMLRSLVNACVKLSERIVLPRLMDVVTDLLAMFTAMKEDGITGEQVSMMVLDFQDAFHTLGVMEAELPFQVFRLPGGGFGVYQTAVFGGGGSPLTWGRAGALMGRSGQALFDARRARIQVYVDDPWSCWRGTSDQIRLMKTQLLVWWLVLGPGISWAKVQHGTQVKWIGAWVTAAPRGAAELSLPKAFLDDIRAEATEMIGMPTTPLRRLRRLAGKASWAGGFIPAISSMITPFWATAADVERGKGLPHRAGSGDRCVPTVRVLPALKWLVAFTRGKTGMLTRRFEPGTHEGRARLVMEFDASPWGYGGVLLKRGKPVEFFGTPISTEDLMKFSIEIGSHKFQTLCENLAMLIGVRHWLTRWKDQRLVVVVRSDSMSALGAWEKQSSKSAAVNEVVREMALDMAEAKYRIDLREHVEGKLNLLPDALSRLYQPGAAVGIPAELSGCRRVWPATRDQGWWRAGSAHEGWDAP